MSFEQIGFGNAIDSADRRPWRAYIWDHAAGLFEDMKVVPGTSVDPAGDRTWAKFHFKTRLCHRNWVSHAIEPVAPPRRGHTLQGSGIRPITTGLVENEQ